MKSLKNENVFKHQPQNYYYFLFQFNRTVFNEKHSQKKYNFMKRKDIEFFFIIKERKKLNIKLCWTIIMKEMKEKSDMFM